MEGLAVSAASLLQGDSFLAIASHYPVPVAIGLAEALGPNNGGSQLDLRITQLSPQELIDEQPDDADPNEVGARITAAVMTLRARRLNQSYEAAAARLRRETETATMTARAAEAVRDASQHERDEVEKDRDAVRGELEQIRADEVRNRALRDRRWIAGIAGAAVLFLVLQSLLQSDPAWFVVAVFGLLLFASKAWQWTRDISKSWSSLLLSGAVELLGILIGFLTQQT
jgi:hypothetical protein